MQPKAKAKAFPPCSARSSENVRPSLSVLLFFSVVLSTVISGPGYGCELESSTVAQAVHLADMVAIGIVDSVQLDENGVLVDAIFRPDTVLKGPSTTRVLLHRPKWVVVGLCDDLARHPYETGERVMMALTQDKEGTYPAPTYGPWVMHLSGISEVEEQVLISYLSFGISEGVNPIQVTFSGTVEYEAGQGVAVGISITNHLETPILVTTNTGAVSEFPMVKIVMVKNDPNNPEMAVPASSDWIVTGRSTLEISIDAERYFGVLDVGSYSVFSAVQLPTGKSHPQFDDGGIAAIRFEVSVSTAVGQWPWGFLKKGAE